MFRRLTISFVFVLALISLGVRWAAAQAAQAAPAAPAASGAPAAATPESAAAFLGDWTLSAEGANGPATFALAIKAKDGTVGAEISSEMQPLQQITDVTMSGTSLVLKYMFDYQGTPVPVVITLKPADDKVGAQLDFADGAYQMTGTATKKKAE
ncbi:MAG: hypothetical protein V7647_2057 [Acidobacteriota bacterium]|jgi:hypothetical protein